MTDENMYTISSDEEEEKPQQLEQYPQPCKRSQSPTMSQMLRDESDQKKKTEVIEEASTTEDDTDNEHKKADDTFRRMQRKRLVPLKLASETPSCKRPRPRERVCVVCQQSRMAEYAALPCGHMLLCYACYNAKKENRCAAGDLCPRCRQVVTGMTRIFF
jgi:hypothetical protein